MRTTVYIEDDIYQKLVNESIEEYGNSKSISKVLNDLLKAILKIRVKTKRKSFYGVLGQKNWDLSDLRDESDREI